jgi:hypothetical protein
VQSFRTYFQTLFQIKNIRNQTLQCTHWVPTSVDSYAVVVYCHGNCGSRIDAEQLLEYLLPYDISLFAFDFSGVRVIHFPLQLNRQRTGLYVLEQRMITISMHHVLVSPSFHSRVLGRLRSLRRGHVHAGVSASAARQALEPSGSYSAERFRNATA